MGVLKFEEYLREEAREWDVVGTTDLSFPGAAIKEETWKQFYNEPPKKIIFRGDLASHIAIVVRGNDGRWWFAEMVGTKHQVRYRNLVTGALLDPGDYVYIHPENQEKWQKVTIKSGLVLTDPQKYNHKHPFKHVVFIGRLKELDNADLRCDMNEWVFTAYKIGKQYDYPGLLEYPKWLSWMQVQDRPDWWYCSEMPRHGFERYGIPYPESWKEKVSPMDHQLWDRYEMVYKMDVRRGV